MPAKLTFEELARYLRDGLNRLHDPSYLRRSPLATLFGVANRYDTPTAVRRILTEAIEALEPRADEPPASRAWRMYESLYYRYVEQTGQEDVARQLGMSVRQLRREQHAALEALAHQLLERYASDAPPGGGEADAGDQADSAEAALREEVPWLRDTPPETPADLAQTLAGVADLARPLAAKHGVRLDVDVPAAVPCVAVDPVPLRQILLNLFGVAIPRASASRTVHVGVSVPAWEVEVHIECTGQRQASRPLVGDEQAKLDLAHQLAELCGSKLTTACNDGSFRASLVLPALEQLPVLAIDDNEGTLRLLQRYTAGTRYRLVGVRDPEQALAEAERLSPQLIVLDVMMPRVDGWQVLGRLREHPVVGHIPIIVCTILAQEELAFTLGASAFVRKPVTRRDFLAALDAQLQPKAPGSR